MPSHDADSACCEVPVATQSVHNLSSYQPRLRRSVRNSVQACMEKSHAPSLGEGFAKGGITTELLRKAAAAIEVALLGGKVGNVDDGACEFSADEFQEVEAIFNSCIEMRAGHIPASVASSLLDGLGFSARRLAIVETSLAKAETAGAFLDLREFSRLALLLRDAGTPKSVSPVSGPPVFGLSMSRSTVSGPASTGSPLVGSPAKSLRRSRSHACLACEFADPKPHGRVPSFRAPLEPLPQTLCCRNRGSGRRHLRRCSSACHFDKMLAPASVQIISERILC